MTGSVRVAKRETGQSHMGRLEGWLITPKGKRQSGHVILVGSTSLSRGVGNLCSDHLPENESREQSHFQKFKYLDVHNSSEER